MIKTTGTNDSHFSANVKLLVALHELLRSGRNDSTEADEIRDQMDVHWLRLSSEDKDRIRNLSASLSSLVESAREADKSPEESTLKAFKGAMEGANWYTALKLLSDIEPSWPPANVAFSRGVCWAHLHQPEAAIAFFQEATRHRTLEPDEEVWLLHSLVKVGRIEDVIPRIQEIEQSNESALLLLMAAEVRFMQATTQSEHALHLQAIEVAKRGLELAENQHSNEQLQVFCRSAYLHMALSYDLLGDTENALSAGVKALEFNPQDTIALKLLGYLKYQFFPEAEKESFRKDFRRDLIAEHTEYASTSIPSLN